MYMIYQFKTLTDCVGDSEDTKTNIDSLPFKISIVVKTVTRYNTWCV